MNKDFLSYAQVKRVRARMKPMELLPCPFCGAAAEFWDHRAGQNAHYIGARCAGCKVRGPLRGNASGLGQEKAAELWNRRTTC